MPSNGLIVIAPVKPGAEARLRATLNAIGHDVKGKRLKVGVLEPHIDFLASRTIHFARMALLDDPNAGHGRALVGHRRKLGRPRQRLVPHHCPAG
jgi:hypothetical protein